MKKILIVPSTLILLFFVANPSRATNGGKPGTHDQPPYHKITYKEAKTYISEFLLQKKELFQRAHSVALGGYISKDLLNNKLLNVFDVIRFYPCYVKDSIQGDKVFLAFIREENYDNDSARQCQLDDMADLHHSSESFVYDSYDQSNIGVNQFITTQTGEIGFETNIIKGKDVKKYVSEFLIQYTVNGIAVNGSTCGAFARNEILDLLNQEDPTKPGVKICVGIRFFFGYDENRRNDKIRLILMGVDKNGNNITEYKDGSFPPMMERNWPPDNIK